MKRKIKVYGRINLYETSAVGLPAYPDAHFNTSFSLTKSLSSFIQEGENSIVKSEEGNQMETEKVLESETTKAEVKTDIVEKAVEKTEAKEDVNALIAKAVKEAVKETMKEMETERGLVAKEEEITTEKSIGELTLEMFRRDIRR